MPEDTITINISLTEKDLTDFYSHNARRSILMKMLIACALILFIAQAIKIIYVPEALADGSWKWLLAVISLFFFMHYLNKINARKAYKNNSRLREAHMYVINSESIHIKGGPFKTIIKWTALYNMTESKNSFFIWLNKGSAQILPKRDMTPSDIIKIQELRKLNFK